MYALSLPKVVCSFWESQGRVAWVECSGQVILVCMQPRFMPYGLTLLLRPWIIHQARQIQPCTKHIWHTHHCVPYHTQRWHPPPVAQRQQMNIQLIHSFQSASWHQTIGTYGPTCVAASPKNVELFQKIKSTMIMVVLDSLKPVTWDNISWET